MKSKSFLTLVLLAFVAISIVAVVVKEFSNTPASDTSSVNEPNSVDDRLVVYYFHADARCYTCRLIESYTRDVLQLTYPSELESGQIEFKVVNVETRETVHYIDDYQLSSPTVVIAQYDDDVQQSWKRLDKVWQFVGAQNTFKTYVQDEITSMLQGDL